MFLFDVFSSTSLLGNYMFVVKAEDFWLAAGLWMALLLSIPYLANIPQPTIYQQGRNNGRRGRHSR